MQHIDVDYKKEEENQNTDSLKLLQHAHIYSKEEKPYQSIDFLEEKYLKQLVYETLLNANSGGINKTSMTLVALVCLPLAGISSIIYFKPNLDSADSVAEYLNISKNLTEPLLVAGGVASNFILNAYFSYDVPKTIINRMKAIAWPGLPKSVLAKINYNPQTICVTIENGIVSSIKLLLKSIPVIMSTAQYVSLGIDAGISNPLIIAQLGAYGLMHWFAVTHFIENWGNKIIEFPKTICSRSKQAQSEAYIAECRIALIAAYKTTISNTLYTLRKTWQNGERRSLNNIYDKLDLLFSRSEINVEDLYEMAFDFHLQLLQKAEQPNIQRTHWLKLLPFHIINAILTKLCYISYDLAVWHYAPEYCTSIFDNKEVCNNPYFIIPFRLLMIFPLPYLATLVVAPDNTNKLANLISELSQGKHVKSVVLQRYAGRVYSISAILAALALLSWGATVTLNGNYISNSDLLKAANVNTIAYNAYFNGFPIPYVALGLSAVITRLMGKFFNRQDARLSETIQDDTLENFHQTLLTNIDLLNTTNLLKQIRSLDDHEKIKIIFGNKEPHEVIDSWPINRTWIETIDLLINPVFKVDHEDRKKNIYDLHHSEKRVSIKNVGARMFFNNSQVQSERALNERNSGKNQSRRGCCRCIIL